MKINYRVFVSFAMTLQILILLFGIAAIPAVAVEGTPSLPLVLQGTVELNGEPASINTEITAKVNGDVVGTTEVDQEGVYGSQPGTKLYITCEPDNYGDIKFYVNGVESQLVDVDILKNAESGEILKSINIVATSPVDDSTGGGGSSGGGGGYSGTTTTSDDSSGTITTSDDSGTDDESSSGSTASASTTSLKSVASTQSTDDSTEEVPASETGSSMMVIVIGAIVLLGIIVTVGYKLKEN